MLIRMATAILLIVNHIQHFHVDAFEFQSNPNKNQSILGNGTLLDGVGSNYEDIESMPFLNGTQPLTDVNVSVQIFADRSQKSVNLEPKAVLENVHTMYPTVDETSTPRDYFQEITGNVDKIDLFSADVEKGNYPNITLKSSASNILPNGERVPVHEQQMLKALNSTLHITTTSTEDPPAQPDLLLLARLKEIEAMEAVEDKTGQSGEASQCHVAAIHAVTMLISMRTASCLVQLLWE